MAERVRLVEAAEILGVPVRTVQALAAEAKASAERTRPAQPIERFGVDRAAEILKCSTGRLAAAAAGGLIPSAAKIGRRWTFDIVRFTTFARRVHKSRQLRQELNLGPHPDERKRSLIYFIRSGEMVKIGISTDYCKRLKSLQTAFPHPLEVLVVINGTRASEAALHRRFAHLRTTGEWFRLDQEIAEHVRQLKYGRGA